MMASARRERAAAHRIYPGADPSE